MTSPVRREQRFTRDRSCPICNGSQDLPSGNRGSAATTPFAMPFVFVLVFFDCCDCC